MNPRAHAGSPPLDGLLLPVPGALQGRYPQRPLASGDAVDRMLRRMTAALPEAFGRRRRARFVAAVRHARTQAPPFGCAAFDTWIRTVRAGVGRDGLTDDALAPAMAAATIACHHVLGLDPFDTQIITARVMLDARLAEMATGEGKTVAALLAAASAAMAGIPVHLMTANDYLAARDAAELAPVYAALGLRVACLDTDASPQARRDAYRADVTYGTAREFIFDYLRDRLAGVGVGSGLRGRLRVHAAVPGAAPGAATSGPVMRGLCLALIDEADSVLIDEARTPFVLARAEHDPGQIEACRRALKIAGRLTRDFDFTTQSATRSAELTDLGRQRADLEAAGLPGIWRHRRQREALLETALSALHLYRRDVDYVVRAGKVEIVDVNTGRIADGRVWSHGLHTLIELKEGCAPSPGQRTAAQLSFQRFFPRYLRLGGMSGTLTEAAGELASTYGLRVERVPLRRASRRVDLGTRVYTDPRSRWRAVIASIRAQTGRGRPVLVGTDSIADSMALSRRLHRLRVAHQVLTAHQSAEEAQAVAGAGRAGTVTIATNMAGRGTDIKLDDTARAAGGLHVICCQQNASGRIDRQLWGRAARQGDPGSHETLLCLSQGLLGSRLPPQLRLWVSRVAAPRAPLPDALARMLVAGVRSTEEARHRAQRMAMMRADAQLADSLSFSTEFE